MATVGSLLYALVSTSKIKPMSHSTHPVATPAQIHQALAWRYATKRFDSTRSIDEATWEALVESLRLSPSSFGLQPWRFIEVGDVAVRERLRAASWDQPQIVEATKLVVLARRSPVTAADVASHIQNVAAQRGTAMSELAGYQRMIEGFISRPGFSTDEWAAKQVYIALGTFMTCAAMLGVDTCPMEGIDPGQFDEVLGLGGTGYRTTVVVTAGVRAAADGNAKLAKVRFPRDRVLARR